MDGKEMGGEDVGEGLSRIGSQYAMQLVRMAGEKAVVEIGKWWYFVSVSFLVPQYSELTCFVGVK